MDVYGTRVWMRSHPTSGRPYLIALPNWDRPAAGPLGQGQPKVHVICGGGTGAGTMMLLRRLGCLVTAGPLNAGDSDQETAEALGIAYAREAPFTALSEAVLEQAESLAAAADIVLVTDVPLGHGNVAALEMALRRRRAGQAVLLLEPEGADISLRDFTGGLGAALWQDLLQDGAVRVAGLDRLDEHVNAWKEDSVADRSARASAA
jgi:iron complex transport system ATP-binding protein